MSKVTNIVFNDDARNKLITGLRKTAEAVGSTLGPNGQTVLIKKGETPPIVTKDGVTVCNSIYLEDPAERIGSMLVQEAANRTNEIAGDGTTTATILTHALVEQCANKLSAGHSPVNLTAGLEQAINAIDVMLGEHTTQVTEISQIRDIGTISANGDKHIGEIIAKAMNSVGANGIITVEDAKGMQTSVDVIKGMRFDRGYLSPYFVNNKDKMETQYDKCYILVTDKTLSDIHELVPILEIVQKQQKGLLIIANDVEGTALNGLVINSTNGTLKVVAIKAPGWGDHRSELLDDICIATGAKLVSSKTGLDLKQLTLEHLGVAKSVVVSRHNTTIVGPSGDPEVVKKHVEQLQSQQQDITLSNDMHEKLKHRLAGLTSGAAIIRVGGVTELDLIERKHRIEDALHSTRAAAECGIIAGGGIVLYALSNRLQNSINDIHDLDRDVREGYNIVIAAIKAPLLRILQNGEQVDSVINNHEFQKIVDGKNTSKIVMGFNARDCEIVNMMKTGVIDPVKVTRTALENSSSVAKTFLNLKAIIYDVEVTKQ